MLKSGWLTDINMVSVEKLANVIQVTCEDRSLIFDLNQEKPCLYRDIDQTHKLCDPEKFIEGGFKVTSSLQSKG